MGAKTRIIYYFVISAILLVFGVYMYSQPNSSRGALAAILAGIFQALVGGFLLYKSRKTI